MRAPFLFLAKQTEFVASGENFATIVEKRSFIMQPSDNYTALPCGLLVPQYVAEETTRLSPSDVYAYRQHLLRRGRAKGTVEKYLRDIRTFVSWIGTEYLSALRVRAWAEEQLNKKKTATVNGSLSARSFRTTSGTCSPWNAIRPTPISKPSGSTSVTA